MFQRKYWQNMCSNLLQIKCMTFFHFPRPLNEKERDRLFEWIQASGNDSYLSLSLEKIVGKSICFNHFDESCFVYKRLSKFAVPTSDLRTPLGSYFKELWYMNTFKFFEKFIFFKLIIFTMYIMFI